MIGLVEAGGVEVLLAVVRGGVVSTAELLLDELSSGVVVLEISIGVEVVGRGVVVTGGSPAASTPM